MEDNSHLIVRAKPVQQMAADGGGYEARNPTAGVACRGGCSSNGAQGEEWSRGRWEVKSQKEEVLVVMGLRAKSAAMGDEKIESERGGFSRNGTQDKKYSDMRWEKCVWKKEGDS